MLSKLYMTSHRVSVSLSTFRIRDLDLIHPLRTDDKIIVQLRKHRLLDLDDLDAPLGRGEKVYVCSGLRRPKVGTEGNTKQRQRRC